MRLVALLKFLCCCSFGNLMNFNWLDSCKKPDTHSGTGHEIMVVREYLAVQSSANALSQKHELGEAKILFLCSGATSELSVPKELNEDHYTKPLATHS